MIMPTKDQGPKIDTEVALCTGQDDALKRAMVDLRKSRKPHQASPVDKAKPKMPKTKGIKKIKSDGNEVPGEFDLKTQVTEKELKFIQLYLSGEYTTEIAMNLSGYENFHPRYKYFLASKIMQKYESQAGDHRKIMRAMGYGETKAIKMLIDSATNAKSEMVRLNARAILAKCLGLHQDVVAANQGIQIIIKGREPVEQAPGRPAQGRQVPARSIPATMAITK
jgi:hypothetical protein